MQQEMQQEMRQDRPFTFTVDRVTPQELRWLWPGLLPLGKLAVVCGDPGLGKSFLTLDMASRVSRGAGWPGLDEDGTGGDRPGGGGAGGGGEGGAAGGAAGGVPGGVLVLNAEDDPADTIRPRLERAGADLSRVSILDSIETPGAGFREFVLGEDTEQLRAAIEERGDCRLVVIDPVSAYVGATDSYNNASVRGMLKPLSDLAADTGVAVVLVTHMRKSSEGPAVHRAMGSLAFAAAARTVLQVARHPGDPDLRVLAIAKSNLADDRRGLVYAVEDGAVAWHGAFEGSADELARGECRAPGRRVSPEMEDFRVALHALLEGGDEDGARVEEVRGLAESLGVNWETARSTATKRRLGVTAVQRDGAWWWRRAE